MNIDVEEIKNLLRDPCLLDIGLVRRQASVAITQLQRRIAELEAERAQAFDNPDHDRRFAVESPPCLAALSSVDAEDARRWRWWRNIWTAQFAVLPDSMYVTTAEEFDDAVDAAIAQKESGRG